MRVFVGSSRFLVGDGLVTVENLDVELAVAEGRLGRVDLDVRLVQRVVVEVVDLFVVFARVGAGDVLVGRSNELVDLAVAVLLGDVELVDLPVLVVVLVAHMLPVAREDGVEALVAGGLMAVDGLYIIVGCSARRERGINLLLRIHRAVIRSRMELARVHGVRVGGHRDDAVCHGSRVVAVLIIRAAIELDGMVLINLVVECEVGLIANLHDLPTIERIVRVLAHPVTSHDDGDGRATGTRATAGDGGIEGDDIAVGVRAHGNIVAEDRVACSGLGNDGVEARAHLAGDAHRRVSADGRRDGHGCEQVVVDGSDVHVAIGVDAHAITRRGFGLDEGDDDVQRSTDACHAATRETGCIAGDDLGGSGDHVDIASDMLIVRADEGAIGDLGCGVVLEVRDDRDRGDASRAAERDAERHVDERAVGIGRHVDFLGMQRASRFRGGLVLEHKRADVACDAGVGRCAEPKGKQDHRVVAVGVDDDVARRLDLAAVGDLGVNRLVEHQRHDGGSEARRAADADSAREFKYYGLVRGLYVHITVFSRRRR